MHIPIKLGFVLVIILHNPVAGYFYIVVCKRNITNCFPNLFIVDSLAHKAICIVKSDLIL